MGLEGTRYLRIGHSAILVRRPSNYVSAKDFPYYGHMRRQVGGTGNASFFMERPGLMAGGGACRHV